jgi:hypothetical protein
MPLTRREVTRILTGGAVATLLAACQAPAASAPTPRPAAPTAVNPLIKPRAAAGAELTAVNANTEVAQGRNRFALGLIDATSQPVTGGAVHVEFFKLGANGTAEKRSDAAATFRSVGGAPGGAGWNVARARAPRGGGGEAARARREIVLGREKG